MLMFSPLDQNCLQEVVKSLRCSQRTCRERRLFFEMLGTPSIAGLAAGWVPQPRTLHLQPCSRLVPGLCQQSATECNFLMFCLLTVAHKD